jgi:hypothetical protein
VLYPTRQDETDFTITLQFVVYKEFEDFSNWLLVYGRKVSGDLVPVAMRVQIPGRNFDKTAVPTSGMRYGLSFDTITHTTRLTFVGVEDALSYDSPLLSRFRVARNQEEISQFFYPSGEQLDATDRAAADYRDLLRISGPR